MNTKAAFVLATWFGFGKAPKAPGTVGAMGALLLYLPLRHTSSGVYWGVTLAVTLIGTWAAHRAALESGDPDPGWVVIDEVAGVLIALGLVRSDGLFVEAAAWVLFRVLDIWKPGPIHAAERLPPKGFGIMADDLLAGAVAGLLAGLLAL